jgi:hypothetical protein
MKVAFDPIIVPRQAKDRDRARAGGSVRVAIESTVEKHISGLDDYSTSEACFDKGSGKYDARVTVPV